MHVRCYRFITKMVQNLTICQLTILTTCLEHGFNFRCNNTGVKRRKQHCNINRKPLLECSVDTSSSWFSPSIEFTFWKIGNCFTSFFYQGNLKLGQCIHRTCFSEASHYVIHRFVLKFSLKHHH